MFSVSNGIDDTLSLKVKKRFLIIGRHDLLELDVLIHLVCQPENVILFFLVNFGAFTIADRASRSLDLHISKTFLLIDVDNLGLQPQELGDSVRSDKLAYVDRDQVDALDHL